MQFNRLSAFTLGVIITAASVGAVSYANAAGNKTLKACANKSTGVMRYISKGSCKKTETSLSWSQMGIQGLPGVAGAKGDTGAAGTNGTNGSNGTNGTHGQNFHVIDSTGRDLGVALSSSAANATIIYDDGIWNLSNSSINRISGDLNVSDYFSDSSCATPYWMAPGGSTIQVSQARGFRTSSGVTKYFKSIGTPFLGPTSKFYSLSGSPINGVWQCEEQTSSGTVSYFRATHYTNVAEVTPPVFTAPFTIDAK